MKSICTALLGLAALGVAGTVTVDVEVSVDELHFSRYGGYDAVELARGFPVPNPGRPALPVLAVTAVLPPGARLVDVKARTVSSLALAGTYNIAPFQAPRPVSTDRILPATPPDPTIYRSSSPYPSATATEPRAGRAGGFSLASVNVCPLRFTPTTGRLELLSHLRVVFEFEQASTAPVLAPGQPGRTAAGLRHLVGNPEDLDRFAPPVAETDQAGIDYLVITGEALASEFEPYLEYKAKRGLRTALRTVEWIDCNYPGRDRAERMRNLIIDYYENRGLGYVLLAGDNQVVPSRRIRVWVGDTRGDIPTDLYFGDLDYSWDSNNNGLFGEMSVDSVDLYADVIVGRVSVDKADEVRTFIDKVRDYEVDPQTDYIKRSLLPSGWLWHDIGYHGSFVNDSIANISPSGWSDVKMVNPPSALVVADSFDNGFAIFDPAGHGNENGVYDEDGTSIYTSSQARRQTNDRRYTVMTSLACTPGNFEYEDCVAELAHNCPGGGCIAVMMNSRYGWGTPPSMGPSEKLCVRFFDHWLSRGNPALGPCHSRSREEYAATAQRNALWRWCMTEFNLLGDPTIDLWDEIPGTLSIASADTVRSGQRTIDVVVSTDGHPVTGAVVCAWKQDEVLAAATTNSAGVARIDVHPVTPGLLTLTASCHNQLPAAREVVVTLGDPEPRITLHRVSVDDQGGIRPNGILEPGESGRLVLVLLNSGTAAAPGTQVVLRSLNSGVTVIDSIASMGDISPGDTSSGQSLAVAVAPDIYPGSSPELLALVTSGGNNWEIHPPVRIGFPGRTTAEVDTGSCALTLTARGSIGFDGEAAAGRGFRFPETDTSSLNKASFCIGQSGDYLVDRFYTDSDDELDTDWALAGSLYVESPRWNSDQTLVGIFTDAGHPEPQDIIVYQRGVATAESSASRFVILVYDIVNRGSDPVEQLHAGILADFDVLATDRLHDLAYTEPELRTAYMRNVNRNDRFVGIQQLYPSGLAAHLACLDHERYVYPDSGLNEDMKWRLLKGELGSAAADRPYNWSVSVGTGPFDLEPEGGRQRVAFAFVAAPDSAAYLDACRSCRQWFEDNVGIAEPLLPGVGRATGFSALPNPFTGSITLRFSDGLSAQGPVIVDAYNAAGIRVARVHNGPLPSSGTVSWTPPDLPAGVYVLRTRAGGTEHRLRVTLAR